MSRWRPRHQRAAAQAPAPLPIGAELYLPDNCPPDVRRIVHHMTTAAPQLLTGRDPAAVGLLASTDRLGRLAVVTIPLARLWQMAARSGIARRERQGWFHALVVGERRGGIAYLANPADLETRGDA